MLSALLAQAAQAPFDRPVVDWHALAPEIVVVATAVVILLVDVVALEDGRRYMPTLCGLGLLGACIPIVTLAVDGSVRELFGGAYVVDRTSLLLKVLLLLSGYIVVLLSTNFVAEGDYWESEYYLMLLSSIAGMVVMCSAGDFVTIFVALELLSLPAYMLATWNKRDARSNEAGLKYYLMGVFASALMLYGMSLLFGISGTTILTTMAPVLGAAGSSTPIITLGIVLIAVGFGFKVSAVPFHTWAPDTYEGAPTPVTAFLSVLSKTAGFVALLQLIRFAFVGRSDVIEPLFWILSVASMTVGNLIALRQTNIVRMLAYSGVAQAGFMMAPFAVMGSGNEGQAFSAVVTYLVIYAAMNLGAFAVVIAIARKTRSAEMESYNGMFQYAPGLTVAMTIALASLAGIPPMGGWYAKFAVFKALLAPSSWSGSILAVIMAVNSVIAFYYYAQVMRRMWMDEPYLGDVSPVRVPPSLFVALALTTVATMAFGVAPGLVTHFTDVPFAAVANGP